MSLDDSVPAPITEAFVRASRDASGQVEREHLAGARHGFITRQEAASDKCIPLVRDFIERSPRRADATAPGPVTAVLRFRGTVVSGAGEGARFVGLDWFRSAVRRAVGFDPYPGTLNVRLLDGEAVGRWRAIVDRAVLAVVAPAPGGCGGRLVAVLVDDRVPAAVVIPDITRYGDELLEVIAPDHLRTRLGFRDGDAVSLTLTREDNGASAPAPRAETSP